MDVKFIAKGNDDPVDIASRLDQLTEVGMPAGVTREFFVRLGNTSGNTLTAVPITLTGKHPDRLQISFNQFGVYRDTLTLDSLDAGKSQNLYLKLTMPNTVKSEDITTWINVGVDRLPLRYTASETSHSLFNPFPEWQGPLSDSIQSLFDNKQICRFARYDPVDKDHDSFFAGKKMNLNDIDLANFFDPNDTKRGYLEPVVKDLRCIPTQRDLESEEQADLFGDITLQHQERGNIYMTPDFLAEMIGEAELPLWTYFHTDNITSTDLFKRTQFFVLLANDLSLSLFHLQHLRWIQLNQEVMFWKAELRLQFSQEADKQSLYNPWATLYEEDSNIVVRRFGFVPKPVVSLIAGSSGGSTGSS